MTTSETPEHPDELLPWYVNGTLGGDEREMVVRHLEACVRCRDEVASLEALRAQIRSEEIGAPGELGLRRLMRDVASERRARHGQRRWWVPVAAAAAVLVIAVQGVMLMNLPPAHDTGIVPLGAEQAAGVIQLRFHATASEAEIRAALQSVDAVLVGGPGALGIYYIRLRGADGTDPARVAAAVEKLRAQSDVVSHVAAN